MNALHLCVRSRLAGLLTVPTYADDIDENDENGED